MKKPTPAQDAGVYRPLREDVPQDQKGRAAPEGFQPPYKLSEENRRRTKDNQIAGILLKHISCNLPNSWRKTTFPPQPEYFVGMLYIAISRSEEHTSELQ